MNQTRLRLTLWLAASALLAASAHSVVPAQNTNAQSKQDDAFARRIIKQTQQCVREAERDYKCCRRSAHGNRGRRARCQRLYRESSSACSG
jgi:hypothetical protein